MKRAALALAVLLPIGGISGGLVWHQAEGENRRLRQQQEERQRRDRLRADEETRARKAEEEKSKRDAARDRVREFAKHIKEHTRFAEWIDHPETIELEGGVLFWCAEHDNQPEAQAELGALGADFTAANCTLFIIEKHKRTESGAYYTELGLILRPYKGADPLLAQPIARGYRPQYCMIAVYWPSQEVIGRFCFEGESPPQTITRRIGNPNWDVYGEIDGPLARLISGMPRVAKPLTVAERQQRERQRLAEGEDRERIRRQEEAALAKKRRDEADAFRLRTEGSALIQKGDYHAALARFTDSLKLNPNDHLTCNERGVAFTWLEKDADAIEDFTRAIELNDQCAFIFRNRGAAFFRQGLHKWAVADLSRAIQLNPVYARAYKERGDAYLKLGKKKEAKADHAAAEKLTIKGQ